jgi:hypothetical protein
LSPGRRTNRENLRSCQRTSLFLLLSFLESIKKTAFYLLKNQSSAGRPQAGAARMVQFAKNLLAFSLPRPRFSQISSTCREGCEQECRFFECENPGKNIAGSKVCRMSRPRLCVLCGILCELAVKSC